MKRILIATGLALALSPLASQANDYPISPVSIVVPFAAGGNIDITARTVAPIMTQVLGKPVIVENRPGAGGMLSGAGAVAKATPDEPAAAFYASTGSLAAAPALYPKLSFDPVASFTMVRAIVTGCRWFSS